MHQLRLEQALKHRTEKVMDDWRNHDVPDVAQLLRAGRAERALARAQAEWRRPRARG